MTGKREASTAKPYIIICASLFTHRNTILYRIHKMKEDYGIPLDDPSAHLKLLMGVALVLLESKGPDFFLAEATP